MATPIRAAISPKEREPLVRWFWDQMERIFGNTWIRKYGKADRGAWDRLFELTNCDREDIERALDYLVTDWSSAEPPTPGKFAEVIKARRPRVAPDYHPDYPAKWRD